MYAQVDAEGNQCQLLSEITHHRSDNSAIQIAGGFMISRIGNRVPKPTTQGWSLLVLWKDELSDWLTLMELKDAYPVQIAGYAGIQLVRTYGTAKANSHCCEGQAILANDPQIWHMCAENCRRSSSNRRRNGNRLLAEGPEQGDGKDESRVENRRQSNSRASTNCEGTINDRFPRDLMSCDI